MTKSTDTAKLQKWQDKFAKHKLPDALCANIVSKESDAIFKECQIALSTCTMRFRDASIPIELMLCLTCNSVRILGDFCHKCGSELSLFEFKPER